MADCAIPLRDGESLGSYYYWSLELYGALMQCNALQRAERAWAETAD